MASQREGVISQVASTKSDVWLRRLSTLIKITLFLDFLYGIGWFLIPTVVLETVLGFAPLSDVFHVRATGLLFLGMAYLKFAVDRHLEDRLDLVWGFVLVPALMFINLVMHYNDLQQYGLFYWSSIASTLLIAISIGFARMQVRK